jgi:hypothetical protein
MMWGRVRQSGSGRHRNDGYVNAVGKRFRRHATGCHRSHLGARVAGGTIQMQIYPFRYQTPRLIQ